MPSAAAIDAVLRKVRCCSPRPAQLFLLLASGMLIPQPQAAATDQWLAALCKFSCCKLSGVRRVFTSVRLFARRANRHLDSRTQHTCTQHGGVDGRVDRAEFTALVKELIGKAQA